MAVVRSFVGNCFGLCFWVACSICKSCDIYWATHISESDHGRTDEWPRLVQPMEGGNSDSGLATRHLAFSSFCMVPANADHNVAIRACSNIDSCPSHTEMDHQNYYNQKPGKFDSSLVVSRMDRKNRRRRCH